MIPAEILREKQTASSLQHPENMNLFSSGKILILLKQTKFTSSHHCVSFFLLNRKTRDYLHIKQ